MGEPVGEGRTVVEDVLVGAAGAGLDGRGEGPVLGPVLEDLFLEAWVVRLLVDFRVRRLAARRVGHLHSVLEDAACPRSTGPEYPSSARCCWPDRATLWSPTFVEQTEAWGT